MERIRPAPIAGDLGSIGIMGPTRMEYARHISIVDYIASSLSAAIARAGNELTN